MKRRKRQGAERFTGRVAELLNPRPQDLLANRAPESSVDDLKPVYFSEAGNGSRPALFSAGAAAAEAKKAMSALPASG